MTTNTPTPAGQSGMDPATDTVTAGPGRPRSRRRPLIAAITMAVVAVAGSGVFLLYDRPAPPAAPAGAAQRPSATEKVVRGDLVEEVRAFGPVRFSGDRGVKNRIRGVVTWTPAGNSGIGRGEKLYAVDDKPVILLRGSLPAWREFAPGMADGRDVLALEENLAALGYTGFTVDDEYSQKTAAAVKRWQKAVGLPATGKIELGRVVFASGPVRIDKAVARPGDAAEPGAEILRISSAAQHVAVEIPVAEQDLAVKGAKTTIMMPDGSETPGMIASVGAGRLNKDNESVVPVSVRLSDPDALKNVQNTDVQVVLKRVEARDVLSVPVTALLPADRGGYAVQVVQGTRVRLVPVTTGAFADGRAEISGSGITEGTRVGVPKL
ncbi:peptidoglycan-binding protein [Streptomyces sp. NPDC006475]|uniref:peptidoglycan-binding protein n=1 Tax=Streptomyces sp. NPDC006475 TaxID=3155719 RepID=UPI0033AEFDFF